MICARCGEAMRMTEKDTSSGRDIREYMCEGCGYSDWDDNGTALWQVLSDYREEEEAERAARDTCRSTVQGPESLWSRLTAPLHKKSQEIHKKD